MIDEEGFDDDVEESTEALEAALDELSKVKARALTPDELRHFKIAHYALRNAADSAYDHDYDQFFKDYRL